MQNMGAILENQKLVYGLTKRFDKYAEREDLIQEGNLGFIKAQKKYEEGKGAKLTTYAHGYILGEMRKYARENKGIKISREISFLYSKIEKMRSVMLQEYMREPSITEIAKCLNVSEFEVTEAIRSVTVLQSMEEPLRGFDEKEVTCHDTIAKIESLSLEDLTTLRSCLLQLPQLERKIIELHYFYGYTQTEIAKILSMNQVQVSRYESRGKEKLRSLMAA